MTLHSALEDLHQTTLRAVAGCMRRLEYVSGLRNQQDSYAHWGLCRVYGDLPATKAIAETHRELVSQVLSTPIRKLMEDVDQSSRVAGLTPGSYVQQLSENVPGLLPSQPGAGSARHLNSVLRALSCLVKNRKQGATRPTS
jgi:hypothetical protein